MAKALNLSDETLIEAPPVPLAAQAKAGIEHVPSKKPKGSAPKKVIEPLQVRWPAEDVKAIKVAAIEQDTTVSDFMLECFHAYMQKKEH